jgi:hypothetical protein
MILALLLTLAQILVPVASADIARPPAPKVSATPASKLAPRGQGIQVQRKGKLEPIVIHPKPLVPAKNLPPLLGSFSLSKSAPGKLTLVFRTNSPKWELSAKSRMLIQLNPPEGLEIEPSIITRDGWPKNSNQLVLTYKSTRAGKEILLQGAAAYSICERATKECRKARNAINLTFKP